MLEEIKILIQAGIAGLFGAFALALLKQFRSYLELRDAANLRYMEERDKAHLALIEEVTGRMEKGANERWTAIGEIVNKMDLRHEQCHSVQYESIRSMHQLVDTIRRAGIQTEDLTREVQRTNEAAREAKESR